MILLIQNPILHIAIFTTVFKFHYDSINSATPITLSLEQLNLNSIMILLIPSRVRRAELKNKI